MKISIVKNCNYFNWKTIKHLLCTLYESTKYDRHPGNYDRLERGKWWRKWIQSCLNIQLVLHVGIMMASILVSIS